MQITISKQAKRSFSLVLIASLFLLAASCRPTAPTGSNGGTTTTDKKPVLTKDPITLEYWRLFDDSTIFDSYIKSYQSQHPNINIEVKTIALSGTYDVYSYQSDIIKLIADGGGPDMFMLNNTWLPYQKSEIAPVSTGQESLQTFKDTYPTVVQNDFVDNNRVYAVPYSVDDLVLYYNTDLFSANKIKQPPATLAALADLVPVLTKRDAKGNITQSAINLGGTTGIPRAADILSALMMQYGAEMTSTDHSTAVFNLPTPGVQPPYFGGQQALSYYSQFADPSSRYYTYTDAKDASGNRLFPSDAQAFGEGKAAMFIGYSYQIQSLKKFYPKLHFDTAPLPQLKPQDPVNVANYWGETVSKTSQHPNEAWDFILFMANKSNQNSFFHDAGYIPARSDLITNYKDRQYYGAVAKQVAYSKSWYRQNTPKVETIFDQMIVNVATKSLSAKDAIDVAVRDINALDGPPLNSQ